MEDFFKYAVGDGWFATTILFPNLALLYAIKINDGAWILGSAAWGTIMRMGMVTKADIRRVIREEKGIR